jgi:hypothetical protein
MPLHVFCPMGCSIRMPSNRAGRVVRCPKCHSAIRIPSVPESMLDLPDPIQCHARIARRIRPDGNSETSTDAAPTPASVPQPAARKPVKPAPPKQTPSVPPSTESTLAERPVDSGSPAARLPVPGWVKRTVPKTARSAEPISESILGLAPKPTSIPIIDLTATDESELLGPEVKQWEQRLENANSDRRILAMFFALCLIFVAIVNIVPAIYHWYQWTQLAESMALPRWIYIQIFVGAIHLIYAVYLAQIPDWTAMRAVSIAMLVVAFSFGVVSTGLLVGGGQDNLTGFLGIPYTLNRQACIWCVAMLCLATLMSYWGGKESSNWQRSELLLKEILSKSPAQA